MPSAPSFRDKYILKKNPKVLVITENIVTTATALKIDFIIIYYIKQNLVICYQQYEQMSISYFMEIKQCKECYYRVTKQDEEIYKTFNTCKENVLRNNETLPFYAGEWIKIKENDYIVHCVKPVETLDKIAKQYEISCEQIIKFNNLTSERLYIGQILKINK